MLDERQTFKLFLDVLKEQSWLRFETPETLLLKIRDIQKFTFVVDLANSHL